MDLSISWVDMVALSLVSRAAPPALGSTVLGVYYLAIITGNSEVGWIGTRYEQVSPAAFWLMHAGIVPVPLPLVLLLGPSLRRTLATRA